MGQGTAPTSQPFLPTCKGLLLIIFALSSSVLFPHVRAPFLALRAPAPPNPLAAPDGAGTRLWRTWEAVSGPHPLCEPAYLRAQLAAAHVPPAVNGFAPNRPTAAAITIIGRYPSEAQAPGGGAVIGMDLMFDLLLKFFPSQDEFFYAPFGIDFVLLLQEGVGMDCALLGAARDLGWVAWEGDGAPLRLCTAVARANATGVYRTPRGTRAIVKARDFALPRYLQRNPQLLDRPEWLSCGGRRDVSYNLFSGAAFSHHVYVEPVLDAYDVTFKMDVDVRFLRLPPFDPLAALAGCSIMVTRVFPWEICNTNSVEAFTKFAELTGRPASSAGREWLRVGDFTYGMFHADVSQVLRSDASAIFHTWLYECVEDGYFRYRWGDQASWTLITAMWRDLGHDLRNSSAVCLWPWKEWPGEDRTGQGPLVLNHGWT